MNRISIGAQSFSDRLLERLGRVHRSGDIERAFTDAAEAGFDNINLDLMFAVPGQSAADLEDSLGRALALGPEHISLYGLQLEEGTPFYDEYKKGILEIPDEGYEEAMYLGACAALRAAGYDHYEISNFALPGRVSRHNMKYWNMDEYLGIGAGAHSYTEGRRSKNIDDPREYIKRAGAGLPVTDPGSVTRDSLKDAMGIYVFTGLRRREGIDFALFEERFGMSFFDVYADTAGEIKRYEDEGSLVLTGTGMAITEKGIYRSNEIMSLFV